MNNALASRTLPAVVGMLKNIRSMRRGKVRRRLLVLLILLVAVVALLPAIVAKTPLRNTLVGAAVPGLRVTIGDASLGWWSAPSASKIEVQDAAGGKLLEVESVRLDRTLWALATHPRDLGVIEIVKPTLHVAVRPDGSNLEDALRPLLSRISSDESKPAENAAPRTTALTLRVVDATVLAEDVAAGRRWRLHEVNLQFDSRGAAPGVVQIASSGRLEEGESPAAGGDFGRFALALAPMEGGGPGKQQLTLQCNALPLSALGPLLRRSVAGAELSGTLSGQGAATWTQNANVAGTLPPDLQTSGMFVVDRLDAAAPALAGDRLRLVRIELPWRISSRSSELGPRGLVIDELQLRSDIGQLAMRGSIDSAGVQRDLEVRGGVDVARVAAMLPHALRVREDTAITSGTVELALHEQPGAVGQLISGSLRAVQWSANSGGRPLRWEAPVSATFAVRRANGGLIVDSLQCTSEFLTMDVAGNTDKFAATARFDLNRLAKELGQFIDLTGVELAGTGTARADWQLVGGTQFTATAGGDLQQLRVGLSDGAAWAEPQLALSSSATGSLDAATRQLARVDEAWVKVATAQGDQLDARLAAAVAVPAGNMAAARQPSPTIWPVTIRAVGGAGRWLIRMRPWVDIGNWQVDGQSELTANLRLAASAIAASDTRLVITDLRAVNAGWFINEPRVELAGDARWDGASGAIASDNAQFVTSTVSLKVKDARLGGASGAGQMSGAAAFRADLGRLAATRAAATRASDPNSTLYMPTGQISGNMVFSNQSGKSVAEVLVSGENLALTQLQRGDQRSPAMPNIWQEPKLTLRAAATYDAAADRLSLDKAQIESNTLAAAITGQVDRVSTTAETNLNGTLNYDLAQLTPLLRPFVGNGIQLSGREQARFAVTGRLNSGGEMMAYVSQSSSPVLPHWSRRLQARLELPWSGANVYGLPVGGGRIAAALADGAVRVDPLALAISDGRLTAAPAIRLDPEPMELSLPAGPLLSDVRISTEVSEAMLKFIAPVLAGATQSEGHFSLRLDGARVPLADSKKADVAGQLTVHSVRVVPGPMAKEWIGLVQQIETLVKQGNPLAPPAAGAAPRTERQVTLLSIRDQPVNFRVVDGRVHHESMEFQVDDVVLRSQGSVGLDETIQLVLTVPIQDRWIEKQRVLAGLKGQSLQVPITGTLTRPQMDKNALASLSSQLLQGAAGQAAGNELNRALDKLFKPK